MGNRRSVLLPLTHTLSQKVFNLAVYGAEIVLCPCSDRIIQFRGETQRNLFLALICHINTDFRNLRSAGHPGYRREQPEDWKPSLLFFPRPAVLHPSRRVFPVRCSITAAISGAYARYVMRASRISSPASSTFC